MFRRLVGPLLSKVKESTGIVGLEVNPNAREELIGLYKLTLEKVQIIPKEAVYRQSVEKFTDFRLKVCEESKEFEEIEKKIGCGQVEELIFQAKDELELIPKMAEWKPWEVPVGHSVEFEMKEDPVPSHVPTHRTSN